MIQTSEINALFTLMDDPDTEVFDTVSDRIIGIGKNIIPNLENLWENTLENHVQDRIEMLIHRLHYSDLTAELLQWRDTNTHDLLQGALLAAKFQYPDLNMEETMQDIEKMKKNVWLELNNFLTPLEQANVLTSIFYKYYNLKGTEVDYTHPEEFFINRVLKSKRGNPISKGILYQVLCSMLDINARIINIPKQMIIAFYQSDYNPDQNISNPKDHIHFYVDATNGYAYSHQDLNNYFERNNIPSSESYYQQMSNKKIVKLLMEQVSKCFYKPEYEYKQTELSQLACLLED